jgi:Tetratricopeptide repeat
MNRQALAGNKKALGVDHLSMLMSVSNLAAVLRDQGKYEEAEEMNRRGLAGREKVLGVDHRSTLTSVYCLANLLDAKQDDSYTKTLGPAHPTTRACQRYRASLLEKMNCL